MNKILILTLLASLSLLAADAQNTVNSKKFGKLLFEELDHGLARVEGRMEEVNQKTPSGTRGLLENFEIIKVTDSISIEPKANFGVVYIIHARDTVDIAVDLEWVYPEKIINEKGEVFNSIRYTTNRPANIPSASSYSLDEPYEMVKGPWKLNIYVENKKVFSRTFTLY
jgi:hypothetical protein